MGFALLLLVLGLPLGFVEAKGVEVSGDRGEATMPPPGALNPLVIDSNKKRASRNSDWPVRGFWIPASCPGAPPESTQSTFSRTWIAQALPRPMTWVIPKRAPSTCRSPASPRRWVLTS